jgi:hypothetical protein
MPFDGKLPKSTGDLLSTAEWIHIADLLNLPATAREDFERLRLKYVAENPARALQQFRALENHIDGMPKDPNPELQSLLASSRQGVRKLIRTHITDLAKKARRSPHQLVTDLANLIEDHTRKRPHHGDKWLAALTEVCQGIDPKITKWQVEDALHPRSRRSTSN